MIIPVLVGAIIASCIIVWFGIEEDVGVAIGIGLVIFAVSIVTLTYKTTYGERADTSLENYTATVNQYKLLDKGFSYVEDEDEDELKERLLIFLQKYNKKIKAERTVIKKTKSLPAAKLQSHNGADIVVDPTAYNFPDSALPGFNIHW